MNQEFKTYDDATEAGLAAAKKWIDHGASLGFSVRGLFPPSSQARGSNGLRL
jgi:hypothetical protein